LAEFGHKNPEYQHELFPRAGAKSLGLWSQPIQKISHMGKLAQIKTKPTSSSYAVVGVQVKGMFQE
jgi:hypothetical protein